MLAQQLCGSLYSRNATLGSAVSSAIASATAAAKAATDGKDANDLSVYPACAVSLSLPIVFRVIYRLEVIYDSSVKHPSSLPPLAGKMRMKADT